MKEDGKVTLAFMETGELISISRIDIGCIKAIKRELNSRLHFNPNAKVEVLGACSDTVAKYFLTYIQKSREYYMKSSQIAR